MSRMDGKKTHTHTSAFKGISYVFVFSMFHVPSHLVLLAKRLDIGNGDLGKQSPPVLEPETFVNEGKSRHLIRSAQPIGNEQASVAIGEVVPALFTQQLLPGKERSRIRRKQG